MTESGYIISYGLKLYYEMEGQGSPMLLLNGGPGLSHEYLQSLKVLADRVHLVFYDQRGTGNSDPSPTREYTIPANVSDLENLRQGLGLDRFILFGHSWGGMLAQAYTLEFPQNVTRLVLADTFSSIADLNETLARMRAAVPPEIEAIYQKHELAGIYRQGDRYPNEYQAALEFAYEPVNLSVPAPDYLQHVFSRLSYPVYRTMWGEESEFKVTGTLAAFDVEARLHEIQVPTLVIAGAQDMPTVAMARKTAQAIPNAQLEIFPHSRHFPFLEEPQPFFEVLSAFITEEGGADRDPAEESL